MVFSELYPATAVWLNEYENHRTDSEYCDYIVTKMFVYEFVNRFSSFFYIAFIAAYMSPAPGSPEDTRGDCGSSSCMDPLANNILVIFLTNIFVSKFMESVFPVIVRKGTHWAKTCFSKGGNEDDAVKSADKYATGPPAGGYSAIHISDSISESKEEK